MELIMKTKIKVEVPKPRNKRLNDILVSKRNVRHADPRSPSRAKQKQSFLKGKNVYPVDHSSENDQPGIHFHPLNLDL